MNLYDILFPTHESLAYPVVYEHPNQQYAELSTLAGYIKDNTDLEELLVFIKDKRYDLAKSIKKGGGIWESPYSILAAYVIWNYPRARDKDTWPVSHKDTLDLYQRMGVSYGNY